MSKENVEIIRKGYEAWGRGDLDAVYAAYDSEIEWDATRIADGQVYHGHGGVRRFWRRQLGTWEDHRIEAEEFIDAGHQVVAIVRMPGPGEGRIFHVLTFRDGKVVRGDVYKDKAEALEAVGLQE